MIKWSVRILLCIATFFLLDVCVYYIYLDTKDNFRGLFRADKDRGYSLKPGFRGEIIEGYRFDVQINSRGYRGAEWKLNEKFRIIIAGNAYIFGVPHPENKSIVGQIRAQVKPNTGIYNLGVPSYGVLQILKTVQEECPVIKPLHIVYAMDFNDFRRDHMDQQSRTVVRGYQLTHWNDHRLKRLPTPLSEEEIARQINNWEKSKSWSLHDTLKLLNIRTFLAQRRLHPRQLAEIAFPESIWGKNYTNRYLLTMKPEFQIPEVLRSASTAIIQIWKEARMCNSGFSLVILPNANEGFYGLNEPATSAVLRPLLNLPFKTIDLRARTAPRVNLSMPKSGYYNVQAAKWAATEIVQHLSKLYPKTTPQK